MLCPLCGSNHHRVKCHTRRIVLNKEIPMLQCMDCALVFYDSRMYTEVDKFYTDEKYFAEMLPSYLNEQGFHSYYKSIASRIQQNAPGQSACTSAVLEIGCGYGYFLKVMKDKGFSVFGIEPNGVAREVSERLGVKIVNGFFEELSFPDSSFDIVFSAQVIEHIEEPNEFIRNVHADLKDDGTLVLVTGDIDARASRIWGKRWWYISDQHVFYYSRSTITKLLTRNGFIVRNIERIPIAHSNIEFLLNRLDAFYLRGRFRFMFNLVNKAMRRVFGRIYIPIDLFDNMIVYAVKVRH